jgi:NADP-dependent 3-hydroxy acid dehydrogenase YdfG
VEPGAVNTELLDHLDEATRDDVRHQIEDLEALQPEDVADAIAYIVTQQRRVAINQLLVRAAAQAW